MIKQPIDHADRLKQARQAINDAARFALSFELYKLASVLTDAASILSAAQPLVEELAKGNVQ